MPGVEQLMPVLIVVVQQVTGLQTIGDGLSGEQETLFPLLELSHCLAVKLFVLIARRFEALTMNGTEIAQGVHLLTERFFPLARGLNDRLLLAARKAGERRSPHHAL